MELIDAERVDELDTVLDSQDRPVRNEKGSKLVNIPRFADRYYGLEDRQEDVTVHTTDSDLIIIEL